VKSRTLRILLRAYRVEQLRRLGTKDAERSEDRPRLKVDFGTLQLRYDDGAKKCTPPGPQPEMQPVKEGALVASPCMQVKIDIKNEGLSSRFVNVFLIDNDWNFVDFCALRGKDASLAPRAVRTCFLKYGMALPGGSDFARYKLAIFSTPQRQNAAARSFDDVMNLNNLEAGASARSVADQLGFDDGLANGTEGTRGDKNAATVTLVEWDLDHRAQK
jgi:hypothetical protein